MVQYYLDQLGAGIDTGHIADRTVARYPEIREIIYQYLLKNGSIDSKAIGDPAIIGRWSFTPAILADIAMDRDMKLLFK